MGRAEKATSIANLQLCEWSMMCFISSTSTGTTMQNPLDSGTGKCGAMLAERPTLRDDNVLPQSLCSTGVSCKLIPAAVRA